MPGKGREVATGFGKSGKKYRGGFGSYTARA